MCKKTESKVHHQEAMEKRKKQTQKVGKQVN